MQLMLAPMEGVIDHTMRELLTSLGGIDRCVTEFVRVTDRLLPPRVFHRLCPELGTGGLQAASCSSERKVRRRRAPTTSARTISLPAAAMNRTNGC